MLVSVTSASSCFLSTSGFTNTSEAYTLPAAVKLAVVVQVVDADFKTVHDQLVAQFLALATQTNFVEQPPHAARPRFEQVQHAPAIHDVTTDLDNPPTFTAVVGRRADAPNRLDRSPGLAQLQRQGYPDLAPITVPSPPDQTFDRALAAAQSFGWQIVTADKSSGRIEATDTTRWFGFVDDVAVRLTPWGTGTRIDVRSVSRTGIGDAGRNAGRIRRFLKELQK